MSGLFEKPTFQMLRRFWRLWLAPAKAQIAGVLGLMVLAAVMTAAYPLVIQWTFNRIEQKDIQTLLLIPLAIVAVTGLRALVLYIQAVATSAMVNSVIVTVQDTLYSHLVGADLARLQREATGTLTSRFTADIEALRMALNRCLTGFIRDGFTVVVLFSVVIYLDPLLALIVLFVYPIAGIPIIRLGKRIRNNASVLQAGIGALTAFLQQSFGGMRMIKSYRLEDVERTRAHSAFHHLYATLMKAARLRARVDPLLEVAGGVAVAGVLWFGTWRVMTGGGTVGGFTGFVTALLMAAQPVRSLGSLNAIFQEGMAAMQRLFSVLDEKPKVIERPDAGPLQVRAGKIELKNVFFSYTETNPVLRGLSLTAEPGEMVALVGRSGGGKSTIFNLVSRFYDADNGEVSIDGQNLRDVTLKSLRDAVTLVSQDAIIFNDTAQANIAFGRAGASQEEIIQAAKNAEADEFIARLPQAYDTAVGEHGGFLSGGQKQRLVLARAFLRNSPILLLDEATSALDAASEDLVRQAIRRLAQGRTTLIIAHRLATVKDANRICVIEKGQVVEEGRHDELLAKGGLYAELYKLQFKE